jgi:hypothetical protein
MPSILQRFHEYEQFQVFSHKLCLLITFSSKELKFKERPFLNQINKNIYISSPELVVMVNITHIAEVSENDWLYPSSLLWTLLECSISQKQSINFSC